MSTFKIKNDGSDSIRSVKKATVVKVGKGYQAETSY